MGRKKGSPDITEKVRGAILYVKTQNPEYSAEKIRKHLMKNRKAFDIKLNEKIPQKRAIQLVVKEGMPRIKQLQSEPLDKPWSLSALDENPLSPHTIAMIFKLKVEALKAERNPTDYLTYYTRLQKLKEELKVEPTDELEEKLKEEITKELKARELNISIRDARWLDRLSLLQFTDGILLFFAQRLSKHEIMSQLSGNKAFDSYMILEREILETMKDSRKLKILKDLTEHYPEGFNSRLSAEELIEDVMRLKEGTHERAFDKKVSE